MAQKLEFVTQNDGRTVSKYFYWLMTTIHVSIFFTLLSCQVVKTIAQVIRATKEMELREALTYAQFHMFAWMLDEVFEDQPDSEWTRRGGAKEYFR